jgi:hypothetical protein
MLFGTRLQDLPVELVEGGEGCQMGKILISVVIKLIYYNQNSIK